MKIALITDQHLDGRKGSLAFWNFFQMFYDEVFFPTLEKEKVSTIIDLGDTFDNRKYIDFNTFNRVKENYFERLHGYEVHMILGNHCIYYKNTNRVNSPELLLNQYSNIRIYASPEHIKLGSKKFLMLPWINTENRGDILNLLETSDADNVCGHLEINGFEITSGMKFDHGGLEASMFKNFKRVWSGHFHHRSKKGNIQYLGNPYQMFWNDYKDTRGFHIYDTETDKLKFVANPFEIFEKIFYNDKKEDYNKKDVSCYKDKYIKIVVEEKWDYQMFETLIDRLYNLGVHGISIVENLVSEDTVADIDISSKDTLTLLNEYIDDVEMSVDKIDLKNLVRSLYIESCNVA
jgi:hypothetical protein